jgi:hypothetical protein
MHLEFNSDRRRSLRKCQSALCRLSILNGMHRLRLHPRHVPFSFRNWRLSARVVPDTSVRRVVPGVACAAPRVPIQKQARPAVMMHRLFRPRGHSHLQHPHKRVFKKDPMTVRCNLHRIVAIRKARFLLPETIRPAHPENRRTQQQNQRGKAALSRLQKSSCPIHARSIRSSWAGSPYIKSNPQPWVSRSRRIKVKNLQEQKS